MIIAIQKPDDEDKPISSDPRREKYLRQVARNCAKVLEACRLILRELGFEENHWRLISALIRVGRDRLNPFRASHEWLRDQYKKNGDQVGTDKTVQRDIKKLLEEQYALRVRVIRYWPGSKNLITGECHSSRFQNLILRSALEAIDKAIDNIHNYEYTFQALEVACKDVAANMPRYKTPQDPETAEAREMTDGLDALSEEHSEEKLNTEVRTMRETRRIVDAIARLFGELAEHGAEREFLARLGENLIADALKKLNREPDHIGEGVHSSIEEDRGSLPRTVVNQSTDSSLPGHPCPRIEDRVSGSL